MTYSRCHPESRYIGTKGLRRLASTRGLCGYWGGGVKIGPEGRRAMTDCYWKSTNPATNIRSQLQEDRWAKVTYFAMMYGVYAAMPDDEKKALHTWERENLDGRSVGTSNWPGWANYIGSMPFSDTLYLVKRKPIPESLRKKVLERDRYTCQVCGSQEKLSMDHITPESRGGLSTFDNLQTLCRHCNSSKGSKLTMSGSSA